MEFRLLGPVQIWMEGQQVELKRRQERLLLAVLLLESGKAVPADRLIELLWPEELPGSPKRALQVYVSRLRAVLATGDSKLVSSPHGYAVDAPSGRTDVELFAALVEQAKPLGDLEQRHKLLTDALALWRGPALADVASEDVRRRLCAGLDESRWAAQELRLTTELALGRHREVLPELAELTAEQPTRESLAATRMLALYRSGRQTEALAAYADLVRHLSDELGVEPGQKLRDLQVAILRQDESLDFREAESGPRELPADIGVLMGRDDVLAELTGVLQQRSGPPAVVCLYGAAGTGKSATAVRLGHTLAAEFPDGQLFARLQDINGEPVPPHLLLGRLLRSLGIESVPESLEERAALLRSTVAGKAVLLVLDDAADAGQLRPLLPADSRCAVVVTSRRPLLGLEDAVHQEITALDDATSAELLAALSGRPAEELQEIVDYCVGLPLALRIVGSRLSLIREDVADVVRSLADETSRLDYLVAGDRAVRASLDLTLRTAGETARRLFGYLALIGADEFSAWVAAPLLDLDEQPARGILNELVALGLVQPRRISPPTYGLHALVRARAVEELSTVTDRETVEVRYLQAVLRLLAIAGEAIGQILTKRLELDAGRGRPLVETDLAAAAGADWLELEAPVIAAAVELASERPWLAAALALRLADHLMLRDHRELRQHVLAVADAAVTGADAGPDLEVEVLRRRFAALAQANAPTEFLREIGQRVLNAAERTGDPDQQAAALAQLAYLAEEVADYEGAIAAAEQILALTEACQDPAGAEGRALDHLSAGLAGLDRLPEAIEARRRLRGVSAPGTRLHAIRLVLFAEVLASGPDQGAEHLSELEQVVAEAAEIVDRLGDELGRAHVDIGEGRVSMLRGDLTSARHLFDHAAEVFAERPDQWGDVQLRSARAWLAVRGGDRAEGCRLLAEGIAAMTGSGYLPGSQELRRQLGLAQSGT
ncbi:BTAD domain-containing putative transcriptional regulator [Kribbella sp. NPDC051770]|uniref:AfsR/SARP family transcriptional regulator n=1 Tax=Kribbella sp. NPDC051770 TaxID=3155413 RepID=UPI00342C340C